MTWTHFYDMHSGGGAKEAPYEHIYIEAEYEEARSVFYAKFGHNPHRVTCTCCGADYSVSSNESGEELTEYHRTKAFGRKKDLTVDEFFAQDDVLVVRADEITAADRSTSVPESGYYWVD